MCCGWTYRDCEIEGPSLFQRRFDSRQGWVPCVTLSFSVAHEVSLGSAMEAIGDWGWGGVGEDGFECGIEVGGIGWLRALCGGVLSHPSGRL